MSDLAGFNANDIPESSYDALPAGLYVVMATENEWKVTKAGDGEYLQYILNVLDEKYNTRKIWLRMNLKNPNPTTMTIANQELAAMCRAVNKITPQDSSELCNIPFIIELSVGKDNRGKECNEIEHFYHVDATAESIAAGKKSKQVAQKPVAATPTPPAANGKPGPVWPTATAAT